MFDVEFCLICFADSAISNANFQYILAEYGKEVTLVYHFCANPKPNYRWYINGTLIPGATYVTYYIDSVNFTDFGNYTFEVTNTYGGTRFYIELRELCKYLVIIIPNFNYIIRLIQKMVNVHAHFNFRHII